MRWAFLPQDAAVPVAPPATAGGIVFIAGSDDHMFRAYDSKTGKVLWRDWRSTLRGYCVPDHL